MNAAYLTITIVTIAANAVIGVADLVPARFVLATSAAVDVPRSWLPALGTLKIAGAAGLATGLLGIEPLGIAAAAGLVVFFLGAIATHVRAGAIGTLAAPGGYLALAAGSLFLALAH